ncbi:MAG: ATP-dependent helicase [Nanoarchaeota archaeon]|nr:ATP-dependent helicase [Nanoarchaeota archaeon]
MSGLINEIKRDDSKDYLLVLKSIKQIPFPVGKNLLIDFLIGNFKNSSIKNNNLDELGLFGSLIKNKEELSKLIDGLIDNRFIEIAGHDNNPFMKLTVLTEKGKKEILDPRFYKDNEILFEKTIITEQERLIFSELDSFLGKYNDYQKKAIISNKEKILCIAGAGSGKTTVLTKRIEFLVKYKGIRPEKILAMTFTRKAKEEMKNRLENSGIRCNVETFNSFSEKILRNYGCKIYQRQMNVLSYQNKIMAIMSALQSIGLTTDNAIDRYFSESQKKNKKKEELSNIFMNDCFFILDYFKSKNLEFYDFSKDADYKEANTAKIIYKICNYLNQYMKLHGFRDYTDQILDTIRFFKENKDYIPKYEHVLVDEYQDVNSQQVDLLELLNPQNLFWVGDPRQSIFGWRGSDINYILKFKEKYIDAEVITLTKNYRSNNHLVEFMNKSINHMKLPDLEYHNEGKKDIYLYNFENEEKEFNFIIDKIVSSQVPRHEIFVLARTNRQLEEFSRLLRLREMLHIMKTDEINKTVYEKKDHLTLATIHAIKGLEAKIVFLIGVNEQNFPCKASDHPVIELIKVDDYDKEDEERRLFYVAISRAKNSLYLTYTGKRPTYFINEEMMNIINGDALKRI